MRVHIINPAADYASFHTGEAYAAAGVPSRTVIADLTTVTLAAMMPRDWDIRISDEAIAPLDLDALPDCDLVAVTGKVSQRNRMVSLAAAYRRRGVSVVIGGSYASLSPEDMRPHADVLVTGEIEDIAEGLFADLAAGRAKDSYQGGRPDLRRSPVPRWDLYPNQQANFGTIQTSRGCPFQCDFCDVIQYLGRRQRHKEPQQVIAELDVLYAHGYRWVMLADDNFTVYRRHAHAVLAALRDWNQAHRNDPVRFLTQVSIDLAGDPDLIQACREAGLVVVFIGLETVNPDSLRAAGKAQNLRQDMGEALATLLSHGIAVHAGIIVGFDADGPDIFQRISAFLQASPVPVPSIGALVAPAGTPLHQRLAAEGRLRGPDWQGANHPLATNIIPAGMSQDELLAGIRQLCAEVYAPQAFEQRVMNFLAAFGASGAGPAAQPQALRVNAVDRAVLAWLTGLGWAEKHMIRRLLRVAAWRPDAQGHVLAFLSRYAQARYLLSAY